LSPVEAQTYRNDGRKPALRFATDDLHGKISWVDGVRGPVEFDLDEIRDFNLIKSDGTPMYNWACVCDDHRMGITQVLRGEDGISNTPRQLLLYRELGWTPPHFNHLAFILGDDGQKLSKRHGDTGIHTFRNKGYLPEALINYLGLLGVGGEGEGSEIFSLDELIQRFDPERLIKKSSTFDYGKLDFLNAHWLREKSGAQLADLAKPFLEGLSVPSAAWLEQACEAFKGNAVVLNDLRPAIAALLKAPVAPASTAAAPAAKAAFQPWPTDEAGFKAALKAAQAASGLKGKDFFMPLRLALTGVEHGPELPKLLALLGQDETFRRLDAATKGA
jgi:nondiscriminating glutamyl-tRNA synthetase